MEFKEFAKSMESKLNILEIQLSGDQLEKFYCYMNILLEWNEKVNLTAIVEPEEVITKHFVDSLTILKYVENEDKIIDVGTGAGFPGIPLKIVREDKECTLLDSLNKRIVFLDEVVAELKLKSVKTIHGRAEELGIKKEHRERYGAVLSRAVASLNVLIEYMAPYSTVGGKCICMKGPNIEEEITQSKKAIELLGLNLYKIEKIELPETNNIRNIIILQKNKATESKYPRQNGKIRKTPL